MGVQEQVSPEPRQGSSLTLGDVLYNDKAIPQEPEQAWAGLVRAVAGRDAQALHALYERSSRVVYTLALRITGSPDAAETVTLEVFHDVWTGAASYREGSETVLGWIMNRARARALEKAGKDSPATGAGTFEEQRRLLQEALQRLTPEERATLETTYFSELKHADAAARLKLPADAFRGWIRSGLMKLRQAFTDPK